MPNPDPCAFKKALVLSGVVGYLGVVTCYVEMAAQPSFYDNLFHSFFIWTASVWVGPISQFVHVAETVMPPRIMIQSYGLHIPSASPFYIGPVLLLLLAHYTAIIFPLHYGLFRRKPWIIVAGGALIVLNLLAWPYLVRPSIRF